MIQGEFQRMCAHKERKSCSAVKITEILTFKSSVCWRLTSGATLRFRVLSDGTVPVVRTYPNYSNHHINMAGARRDTQKLQQNPSMLSTFRSIQRWPNYTGETRLFYLLFVPVKDGKFTQGNPSMLSTFLWIQRWPTYTGETRLFYLLFLPVKDGKLTQGNPSMLFTFLSVQKMANLHRGNPSILPIFRSIQRRHTYTGNPVFVVHLSFHSKTANLHWETRLFCLLLIPFKATQHTRVCQIMEISWYCKHYTVPYHLCKCTFQSADIGGRVGKQMHNVDSELGTASGVIS